MRLLMTMNVPYTRVHGGANRSNRALLEGLAARGHECAVVTPALASPSAVTWDEWRAGLEERGLEARDEGGVTRLQLSGVEVRAVREPGAMRSGLLGAARELDPDWLLVASEDPSQTLLAAALEARPDRVVYLALTPQLFPFGPESLYPGEERTALVRRAARVACLSRITADYVREHAGVEAGVYHPPHYGPGPFPAVADPEGAVLLMNASAVKGLPIFLGLARALPQTRFAAVAGYGTTREDRAALEALPNVETWPNADALDELFSRTSVLLVPTLWMESFGMAVVDAMLRGVPVLAADHGALPEAALGAATLLPVRPIRRWRDALAENHLPVPEVPDQDLAPWHRALAELLRDRDLYRRRSEECRRAALGFVEDLSVEPFERWLEESSPRSAGTIETAGRAVFGAVGDAALPAIARTVVRTPAIAARATADAVSGVMAGLSREQRDLLIRRLRSKRTGEAAGGAGTAAQPPGTALEPASRDTALPASYAQRRLFFLDRLLPGNPLYNCPSALRLRGRLDLGALARALGALVARHEALHTVLRLADGAPVQVVLPPRRPALPVVDLGGLLYREGALAATLDREASRPFDLGRGPLFRALLARLDAEEHVLLLTFHHAVTDGWSTGVLTREMTALYGAFRTGRPSPLPPRRLHYGDYAAWQRRSLSGDALERLVEPWRRALADAPAVLELPTDRPRPPVRSHRGESLPFRLPAALTAELRRLAHDRGATLFMVLLASWAALLTRLTGEERPVVGSPVANRTLPETEGMVGFFVNTLPLALDLGGDPGFGELVDRTREVALDAFAHGELPFEKLVEELHPERSQSHTPLFQVLFALQNAPAGRLELPGLTVEPVPVHSGTAKFDLNLEVTETGEALEGSLEIDRELFDRATGERILACWRGLLEDAAARPERRLGRLRILPAGEAEVPPALAPTPVPTPEDVTVVSLFLEQAARSPEAVALVSGSASVTYAELERRSRALAARLCAAGVGTDRPVGILAERSAEMVAAVLAVLRAGGVCVPLDPEHPRERLELMLADTGAPVVLCHRSLDDRLADGNGPAPGYRRFYLDDGAGAAAAEGREPALPHASLAYVLYTSGSTGRPKGVGFPHRAMVNLVLWHLEKFPAPAATLQFASLGFDASFHEILATLAAGGSLHLLTEERRKDLPALARLLAERRIEKAILPVVVLHHLAERSSPAPPPELALSEIVCTGEQLKVTPRVADLLRALPAASLHNDYGPTESHVVTSVRVSDRDDLWAPFPPIGLPIRSSRCLLVDAFGNPVPAGFPGELLLGGDCLARGYHRRPRLTAERFVPDPAGATPGARLYRTGDRARLGRDGLLEYLGRFDHQVKVRGLRVEPGEVEAALGTFSGVEDALVIAREDREGNRRLVAYLVTSGGAAPGVEALREHLGRTLPPFMIPADFVSLERFPLTRNGKIDRRALPAPAEGRPELDRPAAAPRTEIEEGLAAIWEEVLDRKGLGIRDDFFALGGHSLLMIQVASRIHDAFGVELPIADFFRRPTIEGQAVVVTELMAAATGAGDLESLLDEVDRMTDDEILRQLEADDALGAAAGLAPRPGSDPRRDALRRSLAAAAVAPGPPAPMTLLAVPSSDRPEQMREAVASWVGNARKWGHRPEVVVAGTQRDEAADRAYREHLAVLARELEVPVRYAGRPEKEALLDALGEPGGEVRELARFALFDTEGTGAAYGANRNALLLACAGERFVSFDDDTTAATLRSPEAREGFDLSTEEGLSTIRTAGDRTEALSLARPVEADLIGLHAGLLGASVAELAGRPGAGEWGLDRADPGRLTDLVAPAPAGPAEARVLAAYHGWLGDCAWPSPRDALTLDGDSWLWLTRSEEAFRRALASREQLRYVDRTTLARGSELFLVAAGLDGRALLPPLLPVLRREDVLFGHMLAACHPRALVAHLPEMITHGRGDRTYTLATGPVDLVTWIETRLDSFIAGENVAPEERMAALGRHLAEIGSLDDGDLGAWLRTEVAPRLRSSLERLERRVAACPPERAFWAREARAALVVARRALDGGRFGPRTSGAGSDDDAEAASRALARRLLARFGRLVAAWPDLLARVRELRGRGIELARPVTGARRRVATGADRPAAVRP